MDTKLSIRLPETAGAPTSARVVAPAEFAASAEAEKRGYLRGVAEGEARAMSGAVLRFDAAAVELVRAREHSDRAVAEDSAKLALLIAREIVRREIDEQRYDIERIVREALQASGAGRGECVVHLHAD